VRGPAGFDIAGVRACIQLLAKRQEACLIAGVLAFIADPRCVRTSTASISVMDLRFVLAGLVAFNFFILPKVEFLDVVRSNWRIDHRHKERECSDGQPYCHAPHLIFLF
jgi:hypothetical protein